MKRRWFPLLLAFLLSSIPGLAGSDYDSRIARLSYLEGHVSFQHAKDVDWSAASIKRAKTAGPRYSLMKARFCAWRKRQTSKSFHLAKISSSSGFS